MQVAGNQRTSARAVAQQIASYGSEDAVIADGKPEEDHRSGLYSRLGKYHSQDTGTHDDTYMKFRWFKNGNCQITFLRPDLVEQLNLIVARHFPGALAYDRHAD